MSIFDVIRKANAYVLATKGVQGEPDYVRLSRNLEKGRSWRLMYHYSLFYPEIAQEGGVVDGGEYIIDVDDNSGEISVFYP
jgi:hypothetical protein